MLGGIFINGSISHIKDPFRKQGWVMTQTWEHLLFANWSIPPEFIRNLIPNELEVDTFQGQAWISVIPFLLSGIRLRFLPVIPFASTFPEINVRTYVKVNNKPGVFFITLDASHPLVTKIAKVSYRLPYYTAKMSFQMKEKQIEVNSRRLDSSPFAERFCGTYRPISQPFVAKEGTIEYWLTERYLLCTKSPYSQHIYYGHVYHEPWNLQVAEAEIDVNTMTDRLHLQLPKTPTLLLYSRGVQSYIWPVRRLAAMDST